MEKDNMDQDDKCSMNIIITISIIRSSNSSNISEI